MVSVKKSQTLSKNSFWIQSPSLFAGTYGNIDAVPSMGAKSTSLTMINSNGSALANPGKIGAGVIIRNHHGQFTHVVAIPLGEGTNNYAEIEAARLGVQWCLANGITRIHLETDSILLINWLTENKDPPWALQIKIYQLKNL
ncbi:uncharacterized protein LOC142165071 [Nicotiana tabacum]|uniref:Uncharacterized protein LOC142165071 n=1 Tax=Nicotiana tabacum TaxID=4097 RepID=A0AC58S498_TOBAC